MTTTYNVRIHQTEIVPGARGNSYRVRWAVDRRRWKKPFKSAALAESFRSELVAASRKGQAFDTVTGRPVVAGELARRESWYVFACSYADMKWPESAGKSRMGTAETLATVTPALIEGRGRPSEGEMRAALYGWAFNSRARATGGPPPELTDTIRWLEKHTVQVSELAKPDVIRSVLARIGRKLDGSPAAASTVSRKRAVFHNALEYAVERELLPQNPLTALKTRKSRTVEAVDKRVVVSPGQAVRLLDAVRGQGRSGRHLVVFFGLLYYGALRPAEAAALGKGDIALPEQGWGELYLPRSAPTTGAAWGDSGQRRDRRGLKHRPREEVRAVPCAPPLTPDEMASPLARRPYDLRHAAVSTWLNGGVPPTQVAEWAGHSVAVLLRVYAKCIAGQGQAAREQISRALDLEGSL